METKLVPLQEVYQLRRRLHTAISPRIQALRAVLKQWDKSYAVQQPLMRTLQFRQRLDDISEQFTDNLNDRCNLFQQHLKRTSAQLRALNPNAVLKRGYSITFDAETRRAIRSCG
jgi:exodeoxyribonuclease VII large subunit